MEDWRRYTFSPLSADTKNAPSGEGPLQEPTEKTQEVRK